MFKHFSIHSVVMLLPLLFVLTACSFDSTKTMDSTNDNVTTSAQDVENGAITSAENNQQEKAEMTMLEINGTVEYKNLEGGFFAIIGQKGQKYTPMNLDNEYKVNGATITITASVVTDMMTYTQFGELIRIHDVTKFTKPDDNVPSPTEL